MSNKTSDKNVEDDVKILEKDLFYYDETKENYDVDTVKFYEALRHILSDYTRQKQINEEHQKINAELLCEIKELEIDLTTVYLKGIEDGKNKYEQKIKNKIEELRQDINNSKTRYPYILEHKIDILNELLQEREDK